MNNIFLKGRLVRDLELRTLPSGLAVVENALAVSRSWKNKDGEWEKETSYFNFSAFSSKATKLMRDAKKGTEILIQGSLKQSKWEDKNGDKKEKISVMVEDVIICNQQGGAYTSAPPEPKRNTSYQGGSDKLDNTQAFDYDDDIPF